jgi:hypothetical protein
MPYTRETEDDDWEGTIHLHGEEYPLTLRCSYEDHELDEVAARAQRTISNPTGNRFSTNSRPACCSCSKAKGHGWRKARTPPDKASILNTVEVIDINVWEEESIMLRWSDGGLLANHTLTVFIDGPEQGRKITLGMEG